MRNKLKTLLPLSAVLKNALKEPVAAPPESPVRDVRMAALRMKWDRLAGRKISEKCSPLAVVGKRLIVEVTSSVWANELEFLKHDLLERLRAFPEAADLEDIRCQIATRSSAESGFKTRPLKSFG